MRKIVTIFLVSLLGLLGCSDGNEGTNTFTGEAIPVAPFGITDTMTPTYEWTPVPGATRYQLMVGDTNDPAIIEEWYTAEEAGCDSEDGLCMITSDTEVYGTTWKVLACAGEECGLWSDELQFSFVVVGDAPPRFTDHSDGTVTDNNTKLMWIQNANLWKTPRNWDEAKRGCDELIRYGHSDWRLPSISELRSLVDRGQYNPALPPGHPFTNVQSADYWSSSTYGPHNEFAQLVFMSNGWVEGDIIQNLNHVWAVRSGS